MRPGPAVSAATLRRRAQQATLVVASVLLGVSGSRAEQPADWMFDPAAPGPRLTLDYLGTGAQLSFNQRWEIYHGHNSLDLGAAVLAGYPLGQGVLSADLHMLFLTLGGSLAYRTAWRSLQFEPGADGGYCQDCDRAARIRRDPLFRGGPTTDAFVITEAHATAYAPLNDHVMFVSGIQAQYEGRQDRSFDWWWGAVHDGGVMWHWPTRLYLHHRGWGGIGLYVHNMRLPRNGELTSLWAAGFEAVRRVGILERGDLMYLTILARPGDREFGHHTYALPIRALIIYRAVLDLN